jgi:menaquinone-dependent protoporphyrinogen IX oxidase
LIITNVWIIYHSKTGSCAKLGEDIAKKISSKCETRVDEVKTIKPGDISNHPPDVLIVGSRITFGKPDRTITGFVKKINKKLKTPVSKAAAFYTHMSPWQSSFARMGDILKENNVANEILPDFLEFKIQDTGKMWGPPEPGQEPKVDEFVNKVQNFIGL